VESEEVEAALSGVSKAVGAVRKLLDACDADVEGSVDKRLAADASHSAFVALQGAETALVRLRLVMSDAQTRYLHPAGGGLAPCERFAGPEGPPEDFLERQGRVTA